MNFTIQYGIFYNFTEICIQFYTHYINTHYRKNSKVIQNLHNQKQPSVQFVRKDGVMNDRLLSLSKLHTTLHGTFLTAYTRTDARTSGSCQGLKIA